MPCIVEVSTLRSGKVNSTHKYNVVSRSVQVGIIDHLSRQSHMMVASPCISKPESQVMTASLPVVSDVYAAAPFATTGGPQCDGSARLTHYEFIIIQYTGYCMQYDTVWYHKYTFR